jgi:hypothetical protein
MKSALFVPGCWFENLIILMTLDYSLQSCMRIMLAASLLAVTGRLARFGAHLQIVRALGRPTAFTLLRYFGKMLSNVVAVLFNYCKSSLVESQASSIGVEVWMLSDSIPRPPLQSYNVVAQPDRYGSWKLPRPLAFPKQLFLRDR